MLEELNEILYFEGDEAVEWFLDFCSEWEEICSDEWIQ